MNEVPHLHVVITMKSSSLWTALISLASLSTATPSVPQTYRTSKVALPAEFKPPQVFKNANLVHIISLEKGYAKEQINVLIENTSKEPQTQYYLPFTADELARVGGFEVKDRKDTSAAAFSAEVVEYDALR